MRPERLAIPTDIRWLLVSLAALAGAVGALYGGSLSYPFVFDDIVNILDNPSIRIQHLGDLLATTGATVNIGPNRPVAFWTFALNYYVGGLDPWGYRLSNVLLHAANTLLVFAFVRAALRRAFDRDPGPWLPWAAALLWAVNPVQSNAVVYVVQRMTSLATLFYLGAFLAYLRARTRGQLCWFAPAAALYALACGTKEIAWVLPAALLLWECAFSPGLRTWLGRHRWVIPLGLAAGLALFPLAHFRYRGWYVDYSFNAPERWLTELRIVAHYLGLLAWPHPARLVLDYATPVSTGLLQPPATLLALAFHAAALGLGTWALVRRPVYGLAILGFYLHLVVESTVIPLDLVFEHRAYLPSVFLALGGAAVFAEPRVRGPLGKRGSRVVMAAVLALAALWGTWTAQRLPVWSDPVTLWSDVATKQPANARAWANLGKEFYAREQYELAREHSVRAVQLNPRDPIPLMNLALIDADTGNNRQALHTLRRVARMGFEHPMVYYNIGEVLSRLGESEAAIEAFGRVLALEPRLPEVNYKMAALEFALGRLDRAREHAQRELRLNPSNPDAADLLQRTEAAGGSQ